MTYIIYKSLQDIENIRNNFTFRVFSHDGEVIQYVRNRVTFGPTCMSMIFLGRIKNFPESGKSSIRFNGFAAVMDAGCPVAVFL